VVSHYLLPVTDRGERPEIEGDSALPGQTRDAELAEWKLYMKALPANQPQMQAAQV
jgi:hypothetical protein